MNQLYPQAIVIKPKNGKFTAEQMKLLSQSDCMLLENVCVLPDDVYRQLAENQLTNYKVTVSKSKTITELWTLVHETEPAEFVKKLTDIFEKIEKKEDTTKELSEYAQYLLMSVLLEKNKQFSKGFLDEMMFFSSSATKYDMAEHKSSVAGTLESLKVCFDKLLYCSSWDKV